MSSGTSPNDPSKYLESLMQAGQESTKRFNDALAAAMGVQGKSPASTDEPRSPFALAMDMQREYLEQVWRFWNATAIRTFTLGAKSEIEPARSDRRFKDEAWQAGPFYDFLKQSYLLSAKQIYDQVEQAQVDEKTRLQLRFYARQFVDAISPSNFPATNPEVIRKAIETRSQSLVQGMQNLKHRKMQLYLGTIIYL